MDYIIMVGIFMYWGVYLESFWGYVYTDSSAVGLAILGIILTLAGVALIYYLKAVGVDCG